MSRKLKALVCIAHPDDEVIFFGGLLATKKYDWTIVCVTDANADGRGVVRREQFRLSCQKLGVRKIIHLNFPDRFSERLDIGKLVESLSEIAAQEKYHAIFTHGPLGEYGHLHHQDVCYATHKCFAGRKIYSVAYNTYPDIRVALTPKTFKLKTDVYWRIYSGETRQLLNFLPATSAEGFVHVDAKEIEELYSFLTKKRSLNLKALKKYRWLSDYILARDFELPNRPF